MLALVLQAASVDPAPAAPPAPIAPDATASPPSSAPPPPASVPPAPPRKIDDLSHPLTGAVPQGYYEAGVRGAFTRTQSLQGPLDGTWMLKDAAGAPLYRVQLVDRGQGGGLEGAWADLKAGASTDASGFFDTVVRDGEKLTLQFSRLGAPTAVTLDQRPDGGYAGAMKTGEASPKPVSLVRP